MNSTSFATAGLLLCAFLFSACHKRPPAPWTHDSLRVEEVYPGGGGGGWMEVYEGNVYRGGFGHSGSSEDDYAGNCSYRITQITDQGITLEVDAFGDKITKAGERIKFDVRQALFIPYEGAIGSLTLIDNQIFRAWFVPSEPRPGAPTPKPFAPGFFVHQGNDTFEQLGIKTENFFGTWRDKTGNDYELKPNFTCRFSGRDGVQSEGTWKLAPPNFLVLSLGDKQDFHVSPMGEKQFSVSDGSKQDIWLRIK